MKKVEKGPHKDLFTITCNVKMTIFSIAWHGNAKAKKLPISNSHLSMETSIRAPRSSWASLGQVMSSTSFCKIFWEFQRYKEGTSNINFSASLINIIQQFGIWVYIMQSFFDVSIAFNCYIWLHKLHQKKTLVRRVDFARAASPEGRGGGDPIESFLQFFFVFGHPKLFPVWT